MVGLYGFGNRNDEGENVLRICKNLNLRVLNSLFKKEREKQVTSKSGQAETQIDLLLMRKSSKSVVMDCGVLPGEASVAQHRLVRAKIMLK